MKDTAAGGIFGTQGTFSSLSNVSLYFKFSLILMNMQMRFFRMEHWRH